MSETPWELPLSWTWSTLDAVASWSSGGTPKSTESRYYGGDIPWLIIGDLNDNVVTRSAKTITLPGLENSSAKYVEPGAVMIALYGSIGKLGITGIRCTTNQAIAFTKSISDALHQSFLFYYLKGARGRLLDMGKGGAQQNISQSVLKAFPICVAPIAEQRRIVAKLQKLLGQVDACQQRLAKVPGLLKRFRQAILAAACSGRLTADWREENERIEDAAVLLNRMQVERRERCYAANGKRKYREPELVTDEDLPDIPETWRWTNFDHCAWEITVGHVGPMKERYSQIGIAFLRCQNVRPLCFDSAGLVRISPDFHKTLAKSKLVGGEILVVRSGANTGDCCVFPHEVGGANCADLVITRPLSGLNAKYGALYVNSPEGQARLIHNQTGIAQPHFNIGAMRVKAFPLPPLSEQEEIVRRVESLFALADRVEARFAVGRKRVDSVTQAILAKAFRGELVPTEFELAKAEGRSFESAEELLNRVGLNGQSELKKATANPTRRKSVRTTK